MNDLRLLQLHRGYMAPDGVGGEAAATTENAEATADQVNAQEAAQDAEQKEEKMLSQSEVQRIVNRTIAEERAKAEKLAEQARTEGEKLAKMTAEQKAAHELQARLDDLEQREKTVAQQQLLAQAEQIMRERGLSPQMAKHFTRGNDAEGCLAAIDDYEKDYRADVQRGVETRLKADTLPKVGGAAQAQPTGKPADRVNQKINQLFDQK